MFCWIRNVWDIQWIGFKVKIIKYKPMKQRRKKRWEDEKKEIDPMFIGQL